MKIKNLICPLAIMTCFCINFSFAQNNNANSNLNKSLEIGAGLSMHSILDDMYAPFTWNSVTPNYRIYFTREKNGNLLAAGIDAGFGKTKYQDYEFFESDLIDVDISVLYAKKVWKKDEKISLYAGGLLDYRILFLLNMNDGFSVGNASYTAAFTLGGYLKLDYELSDRQKWVAQFDMPLVGTAVRNPYTGFDQTTTIKTDYGDNLAPLIFHDPKIIHGARFFRPRLRVGFEQVISEKLTLNFGASAEYLNYNAINPIKAFKTNFSISANF